MSIILHTRRSLVSAGKRINSSALGTASTPTIITGELTGSAVTGQVIVPSSTTSIKVYGCAGGGPSSTSPALTGSPGGSGGSAQLNGYSIPVTSGEILSYSVGSYAQATSITRQGSTIFTLAAGSSAGTPVPIGTYGSHAGGAGGAGGARYTAGNPAPLGALIGGGGGGGGFGNAPATPGAAGGNGGAGNSSISISVSINGNVVQFLSADGGIGGGIDGHGANVFGAYGGAKIPGTSIVNGGGGGAGGGIKVSTFNQANTAYGGGAGGAGGGSVPRSGGGAGFLIIEYL